MLVLCGSVVSTSLAAQTLYWLDASFNSPVVASSTLNGTNIKTVALNAASLPEGIAFSSSTKEILWSELCYSGARIHHADTSLVRDSISLTNGSVIRGIAFDKDSSWIYYATSNLLTGPKINRVRPDGSENQTVLSLDNTTGNPRALAIDDVARKIYWTEFAQGTIRSIDLALGAMPQTVVTGLNGPVGLAVYHDGGYLFWAEANANTIKRSNLDGGNITTLLSGLATPNYLSLDVIHNQIYWTEISAPGIRKAAFDGSGIQTLPIAVSHPTGVLIVSQEEAMPVELTSFTAAATSNNVELEWRTATELNNYGFEIQRLEVRVQKSEWTEIGFVAGSGSSNSPKSYSFVDATAKGKVLYRLKQIDNDGRFEYSNEIEAMINAPMEFLLMQNYPNPFNPTTKISFMIQASGFTSLKVYDMLGREVATLVSEVKEPGEYSAKFNASQFTSGIYFYTLRTNNFSETKKMMLLK